MKEQWNLLRLALQFYSRIPVGRPDFSEEKLSQAIRYFPLVGIITGAAGGATFLLAVLLFSPTVAVATALITMTLVTGALHEDAFSDFFDGFGGGHGKERILEIMKDSRTGVFGVVALVLLYLMKFVLFLSIHPQQLLFVLIAAHASSRFMPVVLMQRSTYVRTANSKSGHSRNHPDKKTFFVAMLFALLPLALVPWQVSLMAAAAYTVLLSWMRRYTEKRIGGFTGDVLGALQQFCEISFYLVYAGYAV